MSLKALKQSGNNILLIFKKFIPYLTIGLKIFKYQFNHLYEIINAYVGLTSFITDVYLALSFISFKPHA